MDSHVRSQLIELLSGDLDFHDQDTYAAHNFHSFPAKFPPQLPAKLIQSLTEPGDIVLDPMNGSGTTVLEAFLSGRRGIGLDIDPLAIKIGSVKVTPMEIDRVNKTGLQIVENARMSVVWQRQMLEELLAKKWEERSLEFVNYWFSSEAQIELMALITEIEKIQADSDVRNFFELCFSAIIITKSGGVSLALDLAHTRPHRSKVVIAKNGAVISGENHNGHSTEFKHTQVKRLRSPIDEFDKRFKKNLKGLAQASPEHIRSLVAFGNAQCMPLPESCIDLIVTSPPYASNAIDYMRAHKFSLVWLNHEIDRLGNLRNEYIGSDGISNHLFTQHPPFTQKIIDEISALDRKKGQILHRYYDEMAITLSEMFRVLKPEKAAFVVVGSSVMRGKDTQTQDCLADIGRSIGFDVPKIGVRNLDRDRRMMPTGFRVNKDSQIQQRMHEEYIIGFYKP